LFNNSRIMDPVELLVVDTALPLGKEDRRILVINPNLPSPGKGWKDRREAVLVVRPDGVQFEATAEVTLAHLNIRDPEAPIEARWRIAVWFKEIPEKEITVGSRIFCSQELKNALGGN
jgi:hypothetical protein